MKPERWVGNHIVIDSNKGGMQVDICGLCQAIVIVESRSLHEQWHEDLGDGVN